MNDRPIVYLDIETRTPTSNRIRDYLLKDVRPAKNLKDPGKIKNDIWKRQAKALEDSPLNPMWGEIVAIGVATTTSAIRVFTGTEAMILTDFDHFMSYLKERSNRREPVFCGFNISQFDLRFIWTRMLVHGIKPSVNLRHDAKPWSEHLIDLRLVLSCGDTRARGSLQDWVIALGGPSRDGDLPGCEVPKAIEEGRLQEVIHHCQMDVEDCRWLHQRICVESREESAT